MSANAALMASTFYLDSMDIYRKNHTGPGARITYSVVATGIACNVHATPNFDENQGGVTQMKNQGVLQSDYITAAANCGVQAEDLVKVTDRLGSVSWQRVAGAPKTRTLIPHDRFFITLCDEPVIV